jgi:hypothetical protein
MDLEELTQLCDRLTESVSLGPGLQNALFAMPEVRATIATLRREITAFDIRDELATIEASFEKWFTLDTWRGHDQGQSFQHDLYADIFRLKTSIRLWHASRSASHP